MGKGGENAKAGPTGIAPDERARLDAMRDAFRGRRPTINDVARLAGVSKKTVSRVINKSPSVREATRQAILRIMHAIGYAPDPQARGLAFRRSFLIGMIYDNPNPQYVVNMQQGLLDGLRGTGFELIVHPCDRMSETFLDDVRAFIERQKLFGVILPPSVSEDDRLKPILEEIGCDYVRIASVPLDDAERMLVSHDHVGGEQAAGHLAALGHRRIGFVAGRPSFRSSHERRRGFETGLARAGLALDPGLVAQGDYTFASGLECGRNLLGLDEAPTAIFAANDDMAAGVLEAARQAGVAVPEALSVVGFDNFQAAEWLWPHLTTIHTPTRIVGRLAATKLINPAAETDVAAHDALPRLVVRKSTAAPPA